MVDEVETEKIDILAQSFAAKLEDGAITMAQLQGFLLRHMRSPQAAVEAVDAWVKNDYEQGAATIISAASSLPDKTLAIEGI